MNARTNFLLVLLVLFLVLSLLNIDIPKTLQALKPSKQTNKSIMSSVPDPSLQSKAPRFSTVERSDADLKNLGTAVSRDDRAALTGRDKARVMESATASLPIKFSSFDLSSKDLESDFKILDQNYDFLNMLSRLVQRLSRYSMGDVFEIFEIDSTTGFVMEKLGSIDLCSDYLSVSQNKIEKSNKAYFKFGDEIAVENMIWTKDLILNSCDEETYEKINSKLLMADPLTVGGPLAFFYLVQAVLKTSDKTARLSPSSLDSI